MNTRPNNSRIMTFDTATDICCFATTRHGGVSTGDYATLNCTPYTGDTAENVAANLQLVRQSLTIRADEMIIPYQTHGTQVLTIDHAFLALSTEERTERLQGIDAIVTPLPHICLCISTADCIPLLFHHHPSGIIAAAHAGWRGTVRHIAERTLQTMLELSQASTLSSFAAETEVYIGPGISLTAFEVGSEVYEAFRNAGFDMECMAEFHDDTHKWHLDLVEANCQTLRHTGVQNKHIVRSNICTHTQHNDFFSARRLGIKSGRILSGIVRGEL